MYWFIDWLLLVFWLIDVAFDALNNWAAAINRIVSNSLSIFFILNEARDHWLPSGRKSALLLWLRHWNQVQVEARNPAPQPLSRAGRSMSGRLEPPDPQSFLLRPLRPAAEAGSERAAAREKSEVRVGSRVSDSGRSFYLSVRLSVLPWAATSVSLSEWSSWRGESSHTHCNIHPILDIN